MNTFNLNETDAMAYQTEFHLKQYMCGDGLIRKYPYLNSIFDKETKI